MDDKLFNFEKFIKNVAVIDNRTYRIIGKYKPNTKIQYDGKKRVVSILNEVKDYILDFYLNHETISKLNKKKILED